MVALMRDVRTVTAKITPERGIGKFLTEDAPWDRLNTTLDRLDQLVAHVNDAVRTPDNLVGFALSDEEPVLLIRRSLKTFHELMEDTRENAPIATFAGFLFRALPGWRKSQAEITFALRADSISTQPDKDLRHHQCVPPRQWTCATRGNQTKRGGRRAAVPPPALTTRHSTDPNELV
jgi:hypothetical protein